MNCNEVAMNLQSLVDGELTEDMIQEIRQHLDTCTGCVEKLKAETMFKQLLHDKLCKNCPPGELVNDVRYSVLNAAV